MIKYNNNDINDWNFVDDNINKVYRNGRVVYEKYVKPSRLPKGYTEVEYIQNTGTSYVNTGFKPNQDTRIVCEMQCVTSTNSALHFGCGGWDRTNGMWLTYENGISGTLHIAWLGQTRWATYNIHGDYNRHKYDWNKNTLYMDDVLVGSSTYGSYQCVNHLGIFAQLQVDPPNETVGGLYLKGKAFMFDVYDNGTLVRNYVPCTRDSDGKAGLYDLVNNTFNLSADGTLFLAGNPV